MILIENQIKDIHKKAVKEFIESLKKNQIMRFWNLLDKKSRGFINGQSLIQNGTVGESIEQVMEYYKEFIKPVCIDTPCRIYQVQEAKEFVMFAHIKNNDEAERIIPFIKEDGEYKFNLTVDWHKAVSVAMGWEC
ncbi:hypothetical protein [Dehalobacter sp. TeCB1]|jgi:Na+-transporting NADH:ubiquinone oxidoreductase subunit NqrC|uniref:hypothetical protein n=1 Tax=Dehalobacter sp. TeCB1 TaxID=1843715 RepID=UPI000839ED70|nr:hypothetical protein [Dehalobacter sp. TeCB1]OCZ49742.1 hypothetical protein A7D23_02620 [Dehalobacter sp. TeCB1]